MGIGFRFGRFRIGSRSAGVRVGRFYAGAPYRRGVRETGLTVPPKPLNKEQRAQVQAAVDSYAAFEVRSKAKLDRDLAQIAEESEARKRAHQEFVAKLRAESEERGRELDEMLRQIDERENRA